MYKNKMYKQNLLLMTVFQDTHDAHWIKLDI